MTLRPPAVAGTWYPGSAGALARDVDGYLQHAPEWTGGPIQAVLAPHAGLMFSGPVGAHAYRAAASGRPPGLAVVLVGNDPASEIYVRNKVKACEELGFYSEKHTPDASIHQSTSRPRYVRGRRTCSPTQSVTGRPERWISSASCTPVADAPTTSTRPSGNWFGLR